MKKVGIIGCGGIAQVHAWVLREMEDITPVAFCDAEPEKAGKLSEYCSAQDALVTDDWRKLCEADLDVVHICTPHYLHAPMAIELLRSGKAVFMEKPCAISAEQFEELKAEDERHPGKLGFCFQNRYNETTCLIDEVIAKGQIGKVIGGRAFVTWRRDEDYYVGNPWKGRLATEGGGALINQSIHTLDLLIRYLGKPCVVKGAIASHHFKENTGIEVEDTVEAWLKFSGDRRACFYASNGYVTDAPVILELQGKDGYVCMNGQEVSVFTNDAPPMHFMRERKQGIGKGYWGCGHKACIEDYYRKLREGKKFQNSLEGVETTFRTVMKIYEDAGRS